MAVDTREKRMSMLNFGDGCSLHLLFEADGTVDADDRLHLLDLYSGIAAAGGIVWTLLEDVKLYTSTHYPSSTTWYYEATMKATSGTACSRAYDKTLGAAVSDSEITTTSGTYTRVRSIAVTLVDGHEYQGQVGTSGADGGDVVGSRLIGF